MISTRRIVAAVGLAISVTGLAVPAASAATAPGTGKLDPIAELDSLAVSDLPVADREQIPTIRQGLRQLKGLDQLEQLHQVTDLAAPAFGLVPAIQH
ncbi:hypothetical protein QFZ75_000769 [Streptomyces sp. V3I8]|uniref:hypothetical protein n=1 Tax=Streptomyces sp. V3I8 TaxID=3042279 RepID=UPI00277E37ED|nr:hypothetical protein [Streptomyces sp. V3I8]MDQ1034353.1 hypothetical protein [Streptomyces sp. V3I8]